MQMKMQNNQTKFFLQKYAVRISVFKTFSAGDKNCVLTCQYESDKMY